MGLSSLRADVRSAEQALQTERTRAGTFIADGFARVKGWFGPWRILAAGAAVGGLVGWRDSASPVGNAQGPESDSTPASSRSESDGGSRFSDVLGQATQVVQLISLAAPLLAQLSPLAQALGDLADAAAARPSDQSAGPVQRS